jgi:hypothetical protein
MILVFGLGILASMWVTEVLHRRVRARFLEAVDRRVELLKEFDAREAERHRVMLATITAFERSRALPHRRATGAPS